MKPLSLSDVNAYGGGVQGVLQPYLGLIPAFFLPALKEKLGNLKGPSLVKIGGLKHREHLTRTLERGGPL